MKFMNLKRFASTTLAGVMALSLAVPAFAAGANTTITGTVAEITLNVTVPDTGDAVINPYGLPYKMGESNVVGQQIVTTAPLLIQNKSTAALKVTADVTGTQGTGVTLDGANASTNYDTAATKNLQVKFQAFEAAGVDANTAGDKDALITKFIALKDSDASLEAVVTTAATPATDVNSKGDLVLREAKDGELQSGGAAFFRLSGKVAKKAAWATSDTFSAKIAFTFEPSTYIKSAGTIAGTTTIASSGSEDLTLTPALPSGVTVAKWEWSSKDESKATVVPKAGDTTGLKGTVSHVAAGSTDITVSGVGSDGITYSATATVTLNA